MTTVRPLERMCQTQTQNDLSFNATDAGFKHRVFTLNTSVYPIRICAQLLGPLLQEDIVFLT